MRWTDGEKELLVQLVKQHTVNGRVEWNKISTKLDGKSANKCKTMYTLQMGNGFQNSSYRWSEKQATLLFCCVYYYGTQWKLIQKNYFPELTTNQLRLKHYYRVHQLEALKNGAKALFAGTNVTQSQVKMMLSWLQVFCDVRKKMLSEQVQMSEGEQILPTEPLLKLCFDRYLHKFHEFWNTNFPNVPNSEEFIVGKL